MSVCLSVCLHTSHIQTHLPKRRTSSNISIGFKHPVKLTFVFLVYFPSLKGNLGLRNQHSMCSSLFLLPSIQRSKLLIDFRKILYKMLPVPVAARSKAWACGRSAAEMVGSNPTGGMDVCLF